MPFTVAHAAAVLPLRKLGNSRLPLAAMMIGSMSPDFGYFIPGSLSRASSHDLEGILFFCWPVSLALWLLFIHFIERPTIELLPAAWRARVPRSDRTISVRTLGYASLAVILGAITHVVWDAFTHANTAVAGAFPFLQAEVFELRGRPIHVYFVLQVLCSAMGLLALAIWAFRMRHAPPVESGGRESRSTLTDRARIGAALFVLIISAATALLSYASFADSSLERRLFELLIGGMTGWALAWCLVALFVGWWSRIATPARFHP